MEGTKEWRGVMRRQGVVVWIVQWKTRGGRLIMVNERKSRGKLRMCFI